MIIEMLYRQVYFFVEALDTTSESSYSHTHTHKTYNTHTHTHTVLKPGRDKKCILGKVLWKKTVYIMLRASQLALAQQVSASL